ncbi:uncharacterized protein LOC114363548 isoform X1 [Ostrinia furnacalis]|uniref:uncharacterized protein LOC114363548 isoform X1 n=1 Tax=Ostrinia furnacalis TaxID=93504 RepID=UPI00103E965D|nr:uncharacterized protein LOC114363548 isoform X1 [Ostrinia furnacalis]
MLRVALVVSIFVLSLGGLYCTPVQTSTKPDDSSAKHDDSSAKPVDSSAKPDDSSVKTKEVMMSSGQDMSSSEDANNTVDLMTFMNQCNESFRTDMAYIDALMESGSFPDETDRTPKCYVRCVLEHVGVASEEGAFDAARASEVFAGERGGRAMTDVQDLAEACADRNESCKCERSYRFMRCLMEAEIKEYSSN